MRKIYGIGILLFLLVLALPLNAQAARLNFMLTNVTGMDIVNVRIAPTYYPSYMSENLLKTVLEPKTRIYVTPKYRDDECYWDITLTWSNGYSRTWTHSQLARYNSYVVYSNSYGVRMRQGYEPSFARRPGDSGNNVAASGAPGSAVVVGTPEKVNLVNAGPATSNTGDTKSGTTTTTVVGSNGVTYTVNVTIADSNRKNRDLVFDDAEQSNAQPKVSGTSSADVKGEMIAVKATVELNRGGKTTTVLPTEEFKSGDKVRLLFSTNRDGYVYWVAKGTSGQYQVLFPSTKAGMDNTVSKNKEYTVPSKGGWRFDEQKGTEVITCIVSPHRLSELDSAVQLAGDGKTQDASKKIAAVVANHETKRTSRDLVFEEEDEKDVNTKTQVTATNEPFVATYELIHK